MQWTLVALGRASFRKSFTLTLVRLMFWQLCPYRSTSVATGRWQLSRALGLVPIEVIVTGSVRVEIAQCVRLCNRIPAHTRTHPLGPNSRIHLIRFSSAKHVNWSTHFTQSTLFRRCHYNNVSFKFLTTISLVSASDKSGAQSLRHPVPVRSRRCPPPADGNARNTWTLKRIHDSRADHVRCLFGRHEHARIYLE